MQLLEQAVKELSGIDVDALNGDAAVELARTLAPCKHKLDAVLMAVTAKAVECNRHNVDGASSGAEWVARVVGVSQRSARSQLATQKQLNDLPDVSAAVMAGEISVDEVSAVVRAADGNPAIASELLDVARSGSIELVQRRAQEIRAAEPSSAAKRERLRQSQFVNVSADIDSMVRGEFCLLPEFGMPLLSAAVMSKGHSAWEVAEDWAERLKVSKVGRGPELVFHLEVTDKLELGERCELEGVGPAPMHLVADVLDEASRTLVGTTNNKLAYFSTEDRRSTAAPLPEWLKRAIRLKAYGVCEHAGCTQPAQEVDHRTARSKLGTNDPDNLQALCEGHHDAKTKRDAPWTAGAIFGLAKRRRKAPPATLFEDTG